MRVQWKLVRRFGVVPLVLAGLALAEPLRGQQPAVGDATAQRTIRVSGTGEARVRPDAARLTFAVETFASNAREAGQENARTMERVVQALTGAGVPRGDITTSNYMVFPEYVHDPNSPAPERVRGYRATNRVVLRTGQLNRMGELIDLALAAGANRVDGIMFEARASEAGQAEALRQAVERARASAQTIASALGVRLGPILDASTGVESAPPIPFFRGRAEAMAADVAAPTPIEPGEQTLHARVTLVFAIEGS